MLTKMLTGTANSTKNKYYHGLITAMYYHKYVFV